MGTDKIIPTDEMQITHPEVRVVEAIGIAICAVISIDTILLPICTSGCVICISSVGIILSVPIRPVGRRIKRLWEEGIAIGRIVECRVRYCTTILLCARVVVYQNGKCFWRNTASEQVSLEVGIFTRSFQKAVMLDLSDRHCWYTNRDRIVNAISMELSFSHESVEISLLNSHLRAGHSEEIHNAGTVKYCSGPH